MRVFSPGIWIVVGVITLFGGRLSWVSANFDGHRKEIASAFGSVSLFYGGAQMNSDGSQFTYVATSDNGYGLFHYNTAIGHKQILSEAKNRMGPWGDIIDVHAWPWSPDDSSFIYSTYDKLIIYPSDTNAPSIQNAIDASDVTDVVWLNPSEFAFVVGGTNICYAKRQPDGQWRSHELPDKDRIFCLADKVSCLTAVDTNVIAWVQANYICRINLTENMTGTNSPFASLVPDSYAAPPTNNLMLWLDASTLQQTDQTPVTGLADRSSKKNDAIVNGTSPIYNAPGNPRALNGKGTIHFNFVSTGSITADGLKTRSRLGITGSAPRTVFAVTRRDDWRQVLISIGDTSGRGTYFGVNYLYDSFDLPGGWGYADNRIHSPDASNWSLLEAAYDGTSQRVYVNGVLGGTTTYPFDTADKALEIGRRTADKNGDYANGSDGDFAELLVYNTALRPAECRQVENYLAGKWFGTRLLSQSPIVWCDPQMTGIRSFSYSKESGQFLINRTENKRDSLWHYNPKATHPNNASKIAEASSIRDAQWVGEKSCAYTVTEGNKKGLVMFDSLGKEEKTPVIEDANVIWFKMLSDKKQLLFLGTVSNEMSAGIWHYDIASERVRSVVSCSTHPSPYAKNGNVINLPSERWGNSTIYFPANFDRHKNKKYPVVIGNTLFGVAVNGSHGRLWVPAIAACGAFVVIVDRADWTAGIEKWGDNVMGVYQRLIQEPCIDKQRVFLFGASAETHYISKFITNSPGLWKGVILLNPAGLPDFSGLPLTQPGPKILLSVGGEDHADQWLKKYQLDALNNGAMVDVIIHPGEGHHLVGNAAQLERTRAMMHFIFEE